MTDLHRNFAYSTIATAPSPASSGTSLVVSSGQGSLFPTPPFNATVWPASSQPTTSNAEIVRVTAISTDTFTITRTQEGTNPRNIIVGDQIAATITSKTLEDTEEIVSSWSPYIWASTGQGVQTLMSNFTAQTGTGSVFVFPVTVSGNAKFNQILVPVAYSYVTSAVGEIRASHYSRFGIYTLTGNTLNLITSNSFSIGETLNSVSLTWNFPTSTATSGYRYGSFMAGNLTATAQMVSYISNSRVVGLQFGQNMNLSNNVYWIALLQLRSTSISSTFGLSNMGIIGQPILAVNQAGSGAALLPFGLAGSQWTNSNTHLTGWWGRHIIGFVTATSITNQLGTAIPPAITLSALGGVAAASTGTILPAITFVNTLQNG